MRAVSSSSLIEMRDMYACFDADVMTSRSSACLRRSAALPDAYGDHALWIMISDAPFTMRSSPAMKTTDAIEHAKPSHTVRTCALWRRSAL